MAGRHLFRVGVCLTALVTAGCGGARSLNDLLADPAKYRDRSVTVRGTVAESASVLGNGAYRITDDEQGLSVRDGRFTEAQRCRLWRLGRRT